MSNRLKNEHSPYLQQHANNPVDWYPWGDEAFIKAEKENKAIFLSIGYSSCHWCHVMERESFEDEAIAAILNEHFISIKVDREERPDIDKHFQTVYQLMNGRPGGWPTSLFLTQERKPFYSATYIPPEPRYGMMGLGELLTTIHSKYALQKETLVEKADEILRFINPKEDKIQATKLDTSIIKRFEDQASQLFDVANGGFNKAPKFPQVSTLELLLDTYLHTKEEKTLSMATETLDAMSKGGLYDLVEGGFCRYSTDDIWLVPHFEKMTYDNALLSGLYLKAYQITSNESYRDIGLETIDFMLDKMSQDNLFYSASDADSDGVEGKYFVYSYDEAIKAFEQASIPSSSHERLTQELSISKDGNFEGANIIRLQNDDTEKMEYYQEAIDALQKIREQREYPFIDKKVIVSWNAMMIKSIFRASRTSNTINAHYLEQAVNSLGALLKSMFIDDTLYHSALIGKEAKIKAFLEDYAYLCDTLIEAYQSTLNENYLILATKLANQAIEKYYLHGKWKFSRGEFETDADIHDSSYPSSLATMISALHSISSLVDTVYKKFVFRTLQINSYAVMRQPVSSPKMSGMVMRYLSDDIILKASTEKLKHHLADIQTLPHPYTYLRGDTNDGWMICNSNACFGHEKDFDGVREVIERRGK